MMSSGKQTVVRTRFAPSPTGPMHMGTVRTVLFNYLFAKNRAGVFILRIEDTDKERSLKEWEDDILENLQWLGLQWDEGPITQTQNYIGSYGPYRQSERTEMYQKYLKQLLEQGRAYWCFCTQEELDAQRQHQLSLGQAPKYTGTCRTLPSGKKDQYLNEGRSPVIRFAVEQKIIAFHDLIRGEIKFDTNLIGDIVIAKDLNTPLYNFTVVIDDFEMKITHVIRGEEHISNTPKQILLQEAFGFSRPTYAHVSLILAPDRTKLSKRHGDNSITRFRKEGYLPEAIVNFLSLLGWNPGTEREIFSSDELIKEFSIERVQKNPAIFNIQRLDWLNGFYIRKKDLPQLTKLCIPYLTARGEGSALEPIVALYQERLKKLSEIAELTDFFFQKNLAYPKELLYWKDASDADTKRMLDTLAQLLSSIGEGEWTKEKLAEIIMPQAEKQKNKGYMLWPFRVALTGKKASAGPFEIAHVLGKEKTLQRIQEAVARLS
ncbi:MAG: glutamate--tRNA ligase [Patescibacteria group bacterium]|mgnify:CR=1 FL=1